MLNERRVIITRKLAEDFYNTLISNVSLTPQ